MFWGQFPPQVPSFPGLCSKTINARQATKAKQKHQENWIRCISRSLSLAGFSGVGVGVFEDLGLFIGRQAAVKPATPWSPRRRSREAKLWVSPKTKRKEKLDPAPFAWSSLFRFALAWCERVITLIIIIYERWQYKSGETQSPVKAYPVFSRFYLCLHCLDCWHCHLFNS